MDAMKEYWDKKLFIFHRNIFHAVSYRLKMRLFKITGYYRIDDWYPWGLNRFLNRIIQKFHFDYIILNCVYLSKVFFSINKDFIYT
jgi:hypothetical protein